LRQKGGLVSFKADYVPREHFRTISKPHPKPCVPTRHAKARRHRRRKNRGRPSLGARSGRRARERGKKKLPAREKKGKREREVPAKSEVSASRCRKVREGVHSEEGGGT